MNEAAPRTADPLASVDPAAWRALHEGVVLAPLPRVGGLRVSGPDRLDFLHGQLAHDVRGLREGGARRSLLLDEKGHARAEATVHRRRDDVHLAVEDDGLRWVLERLRAHVVFDQVELEDLGERLATLTLQGPGVDALLGALDWPRPAPGAFAHVPFGDAKLLLSARARSAPGGVDLHLLRGGEAEVAAVLRDAGAVPADVATLEPSRIAAGLFRAGADAGEGVLPQEAGLEEAFSTRKGCYLGQEIMARIEARGRVKRGPALLRLEGGGLGALVGARGEERTLLRGERRVGLLGGVARHPEHGVLALAVVRHDVEEGEALALRGAPEATARRIPFPADRGAGPPATIAPRSATEAAAHGAPSRGGEMERPIRVLVAKPGLDGHDRGAKVIARALRDAGMEVVYTGLRQTAPMIVAAAIQEDVDAVGLSVLSGAHMHYFREVKAGLEAQGADDVLLFGGGIVPEGDRAELEALGVGRIFTPGAATGDVVAYLRGEVARRRAEPTA